MSPRKSSAATTGPQKRGRKPSAVPKAKPKLKTPSTIKIKIQKNKAPDIVTKEDVPEKQIPYKDISRQHKMDLSNEVIHMQLGNLPTPSPIKSQSGIKTVTPTVPAVKRKGRRPKVEKDLIDGEEKLPKVVKKKPVARKTVTTAPTQKRTTRSLRSQPQDLVTKVKDTTTKRGRKAAVKNEANVKDLKSTKTESKVDVMFRELRDFQFSSPMDSPIKQSNSRRSSLISEKYSWAKDISSSETSVELKKPTKILSVRLEDIQITGIANFLKKQKDKNTSKLSNSESDSVTTPSVKNDIEVPNLPQKVNLSESQSDSTIVTNANRKRKRPLPKRRVKKPKLPPKRDLTITRTVTNDLVTSNESSNSISSSAASNATASTQKQNKILALQALQHKLNSVDIELIHWLTNTQPEICRNDIKNFNFEVLKRESETLAAVDDFNMESDDESCQSEVTEREPPPPPPPSTPPMVVIPEPIPEQNSPELNQYYDYTNDDDDALSLFAESLTGIESSRRSSVSVMPSPNLPEEPEKELDIDGEKEENYEPEVVKPKMVCEKHSADSTSLNDKSVKDIPKVKPRLINTSYVSMPATKSVVFKGVCFFNLVSNCKKNQCIFPHAELQFVEINNRLTNLNTHVFIREYMLIRNYPQLRKKYLRIFIDHCVKKDLMRVLTEMALDACFESEDLRTFAFETTLLHLNDKDLSLVEDILTCVVQVTPLTMLCDLLIKCIAETQNFTRFKPVFVNLVGFMVNVGRVFDMDVAEKILERIFILPFEKTVNSAMISIIENTSKDIFKSSLMGKYAERLAKTDVELALRLGYEGKVDAPAQVIEPVAPYEPYKMNSMADVTKKRYTSPDTTHYENRPMKIDKSFKITRTINAKGPIHSHPHPCMRPPSPYFANGYRNYPMSPRMQFRPKFNGDMVEFRPPSYMGNGPFRHPRPHTNGDFKRPRPDFLS